MTDWSKPAAYVEGLDENIARRSGADFEMLLAMIRKTPPSLPYFPLR